MRDQAGKAIVGQRLHKTNEVITIHVEKGSRCLAPLHQAEQSELIWALQDPEGHGHLARVMLRQNLRRLDIVLSPESPSCLFSHPP